MSRRLFNIKCFRKFCTSYAFETHVVHKNIKVSVINSTTATLLGSQLCSPFIVISEESQDLEANEKKIDLDVELRNACKEGELAILNLMNQLKDLVISASLEYRKCLCKQIELVQLTNDEGPLSELWDDMPQYRTLADELNKELNDYLVLFKIIGEIGYDQSLLAFETNVKDFENLGQQYKKLEVLVLAEFEENKKLELELLKSKRDNILKSL